MKEKLTLDKMELGKLYVWLQQRADYLRQKNCATHSTEDMEDKSDVPVKQTAKGAGNEGQHL